MCKGRSGAWGAYYLCDVGELAPSGDTPNWGGLSTLVCVGQSGREGATHPSDRPQPFNRLLPPSPNRPCSQLSMRNTVRMALRFNDVYDTVWRPPFLTNIKPFTYYFKPARLMEPHGS